MVYEPKQERYSRIKINFSSFVQLTIGKCLTSACTGTEAYTIGYDANIIAVR
jgi:hypothetical protein